MAGFRRGEFVPPADGFLSPFKDNANTIMADEILVAGFDSGLGSLAKG